MNLSGTYHKNQSITTKLFVQFYEMCSKTAQNHDFMKSLGTLS